jgi:hypothetical protein
MRSAAPAYWLPPITENEREPHSCLVCEAAGAKPLTFPMHGLIAVGFGFAACTKDGRPVLEEPQQRFDEAGEPVDEAFDYPTGADAEKLAAADPYHDWRIQIEGPLSGRTYQRQGEGNWVLVEQNEGFA